MLADRRVPGVRVGLALGRQQDLGQQCVRVDGRRVGHVASPLVRRPSIRASRVASGREQPCSIRVAPPGGIGLGDRSHSLRRRAPITRRRTGRPLGPGANTLGSDVARLALGGGVRRHPRGHRCRGGASRGFPAARRERLRTRSGARVPALRGLAVRRPHVARPRRRGIRERPLGLERGAGDASPQRGVARARAAPMDSRHALPQLLLRGGPRAGVDRVPGVAVRDAPRPLRQPPNDARARRPARACSSS